MSPVDTALSGRAAIVGIGQTEFSKASGRSELQLAAEASRPRSPTPGSTPADIDGMVTFTADRNDELAADPQPRDPPSSAGRRAPAGWRRPRAAVQLAAAAVASGAANACSCTARSTSVGPPVRPDRTPGGRDASGPEHVPAVRARHAGEDLLALVPALHAPRTASPTKTSGGTRSWPASTRPPTRTPWFYGRPITLDDHQASRWIVEPILRLLDCCQESDGGVAMVVTTTERARDLPPTGGDASRPRASRTSRDGDVMFDYYLGDSHRVPPRPGRWAAAVRSAPGSTPDDIDVAMIYENFSPLVFLQLEAFGFCGPGEARDFIADGNIELGGKLPVNTNGGLLGEAYIHGVNNVLEAVRQVRGTAANQVDGVEHVLVCCGRSALILGNG